MNVLNPSWGWGQWEGLTQRPQVDLPGPQPWLLTCTQPTDEATLALMKTPRCSLPDLPPVAQARRKRQALSPTKWNKRNLSWRWV